MCSVTVIYYSANDPPAPGLSYYSFLDSQEETSWAQVQSDVIQVEWKVVPVRTASIFQDKGRDYTKDSINIFVSFKYLHLKAVLPHSNVYRKS
jgi:hypothetical protein